MAVWQFNCDGVFKNGVWERNAGKANLLCIRLSILIQHERDVVHFGRKYSHASCGVKDMVQMKPIGRIIPKFGPMKPTGK